MGLVLDIGLEVILVVGVVRRDLDGSDSLVDGGGLPAWRRSLSILLRAAVISLEVSLLAVVKTSNVGLVLARARVLLAGVYIYGTAVVSVGRASILTLALVVGLVALDRATPTFALLLARVLAIVDPDRYGDILIEGIGPILFV